MKMMGPESEWGALPSLSVRDDGDLVAVTRRALPGLSTQQQSFDTCLLLSCSHSATGNHSRAVEAHTIIPRAFASFPTNQPANQVAIVYRGSANTGEIRFQTPRCSGRQDPFSRLLSKLRIEFNSVASAPQSLGNHCHRPRPKERIEHNAA
jgi:hypothetical protein